MQFHPGNLPWILSASSNNTVYLWGYGKRSCLLVVTGHKDYVTCVTFSPVNNLILSTLLDGKIRVWDTMRLHKKQVKGAAVSHNHDVVEKYTLKGHDCGVNWARFHHNLPFLVLAFDDHHVEMWRFSESQAWEIDTHQGHSSKILSCF